MAPCHVGDAVCPRCCRYLTRLCTEQSCPGYSFECGRPMFGSHTADIAATTGGCSHGLACTAVPVIMAGCTCGQTSSLTSPVARARARHSRSGKVQVGSRALSEGHVLAPSSEQPSLLECLLITSSQCTIAFSCLFELQQCGFSSSLIALDCSDERSLDLLAHT